MLLTEKAAASVAATAVITTSSSPSTTATATTDPMTNALELQLQNEERREEEGHDQVRQEEKDQGRKLAIFKAFMQKLDFEILYQVC